MKKPHYTWRRDGDWFRLGLKTRQPIACCDCGLVHWFTVKITNGRVYLSACRDDQETKRMRAKHSNKFSHKAPAPPETK